MSNVAAAVQTASSLPDVTSFAANAVVFLAALAAVVAGAWKAIREVKKAIIEGVKEDGTGTSKVAGAVLLETTTMLMWSESNRDVCECIGHLREDIRTLTYQIERLRDKLE